MKHFVEKIEIAGQCRRIKMKNGSQIFKKD